MTTALVTHLDCMSHDVPQGAPDVPERLSRILDALDDLDLNRLRAPRATDAQLAMCHPPEYISAIRAAMPDDGFVALDGDTFLSPGSENAVLRAAGGPIRAVDAVLDEEVETAFAAVRPPGHHAEETVPMGFCVFGGIAMAAKHALNVRGLERVAIVDFDVHHGNGTQALLADEPRVLFASTHQMPLFPGTGQASERGPHGSLLNVPLSPGSGGAEMRTVYETKVFPAVRDFEPELILISAGFDAHQDDPLASLNWSVDDYRWLTKEICSLAQTLCKGRVASVLEGGYDLDALGPCVRAHVEELMKVSV